MQGNNSARICGVTADQILKSIGIEIAVGKAQGFSRTG